MNVQTFSGGSDKQSCDACLNVWEASLVYCIVYYWLGDQQKITCLQKKWFWQFGKYAHSLSERLMALSSLYAKYKATTSFACKKLKIGGNI